MAVDPSRGAGDPLTRVAGAQTHALFEQHARMVYGLCRALLRDPDDADDATQATFISAYRWLLGGNEVREPGAWLATIARNECTARARARMREPLPLLEDDLGHAPGPEAELDRKALVAELQQAIAELPEKQREAVVLRDLYGLRYTEVGAALGMSVASVESLLFRARRSLRISLKPLAGGALTVPLAVREGIAQALPAFTTARAAGGGAAAGAVGLGLLAKLSGGPAAVKAVAGVAAAIAAGTIAVAGVEHSERQHPRHVRQGAQPQAAPPADARVVDDAAVVSFVAMPAGTLTAAPGREESSGGDEGSFGDDSTDVRSDRSGDTGSGNGDPTNEGSTEAHEGADDDSETEGHSGQSGGKSGSTGSHDDGGGDEPAANDDLLDDDASHSGNSGEDLEDSEDSEPSGHQDELEDTGEGGDSERSGENEPDPDEPESGESGQGESGDDPASPPA